MTILGIGGLLNDASCAILKDGVLEAAVEQKKVARWHLPGELPDEAVQACLNVARITPEQVECVAIAGPLARGPETTLHLGLKAHFPNSRVVMVEHHASHAASAYYPSPFEEATVLTLDRAGDFRCGAFWRAQGNHLRLEKELYYPDSIGDLYGRVTELLGYEANAEEHKVQWLSTTGDDRFSGLFQEILACRNGGWPQVDRSFFDSERVSFGGFGAKFYERLGAPANQPISEPLKAPVAASLQRAVEQTVLSMVEGGGNLCLAGGLALNSLLVDALERSGKWSNVYVQPASGNAGTAIGAVLHVWHNVYGESRRTGTGNFCLGPGYTAEQIKQVLENCKLRFRYLLTTEELIDHAVKQLNDNKIVAWMHGRMEFGSRALGNRSILASPLDPYSTENLNIFIKHREPFRKFAASVPEELAGEYFDSGPNARFLASVGRVREQHREAFAAAILGKDLIRVHTVRESDNPLYWRLLHAAGKVTGLPVLYNTSFNLFADPMVCTPRDAVRSFYSSGIDAMFVGNFMLEK